MIAFALLAIFGFGAIAGACVGWELCAQRLQHPKTFDDLCDLLPGAHVEAVVRENELRDELVIYTGLAADENDRLVAWGRIETIP